MKPSRVCLGVFAARLLGAWVLWTLTSFADPPQIRYSTALQHSAVHQGKTNQFKVTASGDDLRYKWRLNGKALPLQTNQTLTIGPAGIADEGNYEVEVSNSDGSVVSEPAHLWVVPTASAFIKENYTNSAGERLPYFYLLPSNYSDGHRYPLMCWIHGSPGDESSITNANYGYLGYANYPWLKTLASLSQQQTDPVILLWPTRRRLDAIWTDSYIRLVSSALDDLVSRLSGDTNRVYIGGASDGFHAAWDMIGMRPGYFAGACISAGSLGTAQIAAVKDLPYWFWCASDDDGAGVESTRFAVRALRAAGAPVIYTEYESGGHMGGIGMGMLTPAINQWMLAQRRGVPSGKEPLVSISSPSAASGYRTGASRIVLEGYATALGENIIKVSWENVTQKSKGSALGTNAWITDTISLAPDKTNVVVVSATTTSWAPFYGGNTTFSRTTCVFSSPVRAYLTFQSSNVILNWTGGVAPFRVEEASHLSANKWMEAFTNVTPPVTIRLDRAVGFYRVVGQ